MIDTSKDENYHDAKNIVWALKLDLEQIASLTGKELEIHHPCAVKRVQTIVNAFYEVSQKWFTVQAMPRTVLYAVLLDVVKETIDSNPEKLSEQQFWIDLYNKVDHYYGQISNFQRFVGTGDRINLDQWRETMKGE